MVLLERKQLERSRLIGEWRGLEEIRLRMVLTLLQNQGVETWALSNSIANPTLFWLPFHRLSNWVPSARKWLILASMPNAWVQTLPCCWIGGSLSLSELQSPYPKNGYQFPWNKNRVSLVCSCRISSWPLVGVSKLLIDLAGGRGE